MNTFVNQQTQRDLINTQIKKQTNFLLQNKVNNNMIPKYKNENKLFNVSENNEKHRIQQLSQSQNILNRFHRNQVNSMNMNNVLQQNNHQITQPIQQVSQKYTAEVGEKRRLSNIIYNSILKKFKNITVNHISEQQISFIIKKLNLDDQPNKWSKQDMKKFSLVVKKVIQRNSEEIKKKQQIIKPKLNNDLFEANTHEKVHYVAIDSRDRHRAVWPNSNEYQISFAPSSDALFNNENTGYINRDFSNVTSVQLTSVIIPRFSIDGDCIDHYPYILLEIEELGGIYDGTNNSTSKAFCKITFDTVVGKYVHFSPQNYEPFIKHFNPRISLTRLTIRFLKPNGDLFDFGNSIDYCHPECMAAHLKRKKKSGKKKEEKMRCRMNTKVNNDEKEPNNSLTFKISCIERSLDTMFIKPN